MNLEIVVAMTESGGIGFKDSLPWPHDRKDMRHFFNLTVGHTIVMGRKTWESLPHKPLKHRTNIVISRTLESKDCIVLTNPGRVLDLAISSKVFIIGGGEIYKMFLPYVDKMHITLKAGEYETDTKFLVDLNDWYKVSTVDSKFLTYHRKYSLDLKS